MKHEQLDVKVIKVSSTYQREVQQSQVDKIVKNYRQDAFGTLTVGKRANGTYWCVDGQTRLKAVKTLGLDTVPCDVFKSNGPKHEAEVFGLLNSGRSVAALDKFKASLVIGDPDSKAINKLVTDYGLVISFTRAKSWPNIKSVSPLKTAHKHGVLDPLLYIVVETWGAAKNEEALKSPILKGICKFLENWEWEWDLVDKFVAKLKDYTPTNIINQCAAAELGKSDRSAICNVLIKIWNKGMRKSNKHYIKDFV